jgi:hypothetical protein
MKHQVRTEQVLQGKSISKDNISQTLMRACRSTGIEAFCIQDLRLAAPKCVFETGVRIESIAVPVGNTDFRKPKP